MSAKKGTGRTSINRVTRNGYGSNIGKETLDRNRTTLGRKCKGRDRDNECRQGRRRREIKKKNVICNKAAGGAQTESMLQETSVDGRRKRLRDKTSRRQSSVDNGYENGVVNGKTISNEVGVEEDNESTVPEIIVNGRRKDERDKTTRRGTSVEDSRKNGVGCNKDGIAELSRKTDGIGNNTVHASCNTELERESVFRRHRRNSRTRDGLIPQFVSLEVHKNQDTSLDSASELQFDKPLCDWKEQDEDSVGAMSKIGPPKLYVDDDLVESKHKYNTQQAMVIHATMRILGKTKMKDGVMVDRPYHEVIASIINVSMAACFHEVDYGTYEGVHPWPIEDLARYKRKRDNDLKWTLVKKFHIMKTKYVKESVLLTARQWDSSIQGLRNAQEPGVGLGTIFGNKIEVESYGFDALASIPVNKTMKVLYYHLHMCWNSKDTKADGIRKAYAWIVKNIHKSTDVDAALETLTKEKQKEFAVSKLKNPQFPDLATKFEKGTIGFLKEKEAFTALKLLAEYMGCKVLDDGSQDNDRIALNYLQAWVAKLVDRNPYKWLTDVRVDKTSYEKAINTQMIFAESYCDRWTYEDQGGGGVLEKKEVWTYKEEKRPNLVSTIKGISRSLRLGVEENKPDKSFVKAVVNWCNSQIEEGPHSEHTGWWSQLVFRETKTMQAEKAAEAEARAAEAAAEAAAREAEAAAINVQRRVRGLWAQQELARLKKARAEEKLKEEERILLQANVKAEEAAAKVLMQQKDTAAKLQRDRSRTNSLRSEEVHDEINVIAQGKTVANAAALNKDLLKSIGGGTVITNNSTAKKGSKVFDVVVADGFSPSTTVNNPTTTGNVPPNGEGNSGQSLTIRSGSGGSGSESEKENPDFQSSAKRKPEGQQDEQPPAKSRRYCQAGPGTAAARISVVLHRRGESTRHKERMLVDELVERYGESLLHTESGRQAGHRVPAF